MQEILQQILTDFQRMTWPEAIAVLFGVISVLCSRQNNVWVYPTGLVSTAIFAYMLSQSHVKLYAEATLNVYYFIMSVYGWYYWMKKNTSQQEIRITRVNKRELITAIAIAVIGWGVFYSLLRSFSNSDVAAIDAFVSATACSGMWLLAKRKVENWIFLNISNFVAVPLLIQKHYAGIAALTIFLFIVAVTGYFHWLKLYRAQLNETRS